MNSTKWGGRAWLRALLVVAAVGGVACGLAVLWEGRPTASGATGLRLVAKHHEGWTARKESTQAHMREHYGRDHPHFDQGFSFHWHEVEGLADARVQAAINVRLRPFDRDKFKALPRTDPPLPLGDVYEAEVQSHTQVLLAGPEVVSVLTEKWTTPFDAAHSTGGSWVQHFDLRTGAELTLKDFLRPGGWAVVESLLATTEEAEADTLLITPSVLEELNEATEAYFEHEALVVIVKPIAYSFAGDAYTRCTVPVAKIRHVLSPRGLAMAEAAKRAGEGSRRTAGL